MSYLHDEYSSSSGIITRGTCSKDWCAVNAPELLLLFLLLLPQPFPPSPDDRQINSFSHIFAGGYPAGYYRSGGD